MSIDAAATAGLRISVNTPPGPNGGATTNQAPVQTTEFIGRTTGTHQGAALPDDVDNPEHNVITGEAGGIN